MRKLVKYKWFRKLCGGHWGKVVLPSTPDNEIFSVWRQFNSLPFSLSECKRIFGYDNVYFHEHWGSIFVDLRGKLNENCK